MNILFEILIFTLFGCSLGVLTGLIPGLHINTVSVLLITALPFFSSFQFISIASGIIAMAVVHSFLDFIPSILLGAPNEDTVMSVLPGHRMLLDGEAIEAIKLTGAGSLFSLLLTSGLFLVLISIIPTIYSGIEQMLPFILIFFVLIGLFFEKKPIIAFLIFLLSGFFGFLLFNSFLSVEAIFPALSGMFGISTLLLSLKNEVFIPVQEDIGMSLKFRKIFKNSVLGGLAGMLVGLFPGIGSAQAAYMVQQASRKSSSKEFLVAVSGVNTSNIIIPLVVMYSIQKMRSGIIIAINKVIGSFSFGELVILLGVILISGSIATFLHFKIGIKMARKLSDMDMENYRRFTILIICFIALTVFLLTGVYGLGILVLGTLIGLIPPLIGVRRAECMGFFIFPVVLCYIGISVPFLILLFG
ncbi:MAG: tripartite tricarboxylate transporter permease [Candidatus Undinarchaeales archaeon]